MTLLVDTSVWSLALRRDGMLDLPQVGALHAALEGNDLVVTTGLILQELLQGFAAPRARRDIIARFQTLPILAPDRQDHIEASEIRNACRRATRHDRCTACPALHTTPRDAADHRPGLHIRRVALRTEDLVVGGTAAINMFVQRAQRPPEDRALGTRESSDLQQCRRRRCPSMLVTLLHAGSLRARAQCGASSPSAGGRYPRISRDRLAT